MTLLDGVGARQPAVSAGVGRQGRGRGRGRGCCGQWVGAAHLTKGAVPAEVECSGTIGDDVLQIEMR